MKTLKVRKTHVEKVVRVIDTLFEVYPDFDLRQLQTVVDQIEKIINN